MDEIPYLLVEENVMSLKQIVLQLELSLAQMVQYWISRTMK
jgi:hypothetical protein